MSRIIEYTNPYFPEKKWCTDYEYREREWRFRQGIAKLNENLLKSNINTNKY